LSRLKKLANPKLSMSVLRFREEQIVEFMLEEVRFEDRMRDLEYTGVLEGLMRSERESCYKLRMRSGESLWQVEVSDRSLGDGIVKLSLVDTALTTTTVR
jgi:hypothetical protein